MNLPARARLPEPILPPESVSGEDHASPVAWSRARIVETLERRDAVMRAASFAAARFLSGEWQQHIATIFQMLGEGADVSRVYLFQNRLGPNGEIFTSQVREWCAPEAVPQIESSELQDLPLAQSPFARWLELLSQGEVISGDVATFPADERAVLEAQDICSIAIVPVFCEEEWWGFLGFDECRAPREWDESEIEALKLFAELWGAAIAHDRSVSALRASESSMRTLLGALRDAIIIVDRDGRYLDIPSLDGDLLWRPVRELVGKTFAEVFPPDRAAEFLSYVHRALDTRQAVHTTYIMTIGGQDIWFDATISCLDDERVLWVARDVSEQQRAQTRLFQQTRDLETLFAALPDLYFRYDADGVILDFKAPDEGLLYVPPAEFLGKNVEDVLPGEIGQMFGDAVRRLREEKGPIALVYALPTSGGLHHFEARLWKAPRGEINVVVRDITERTEAERALQERETLYRLLAENSIDIIVRYSHQREILYISPACEVLLGYTPDEILGKPPMSFIHPDDQASLSAAIGRLQDQCGAEIAVYRRRHKDGHWVWIEATMRAILDGNGQISEYQGVLRDISARRQAEEALRQAEAKYRSIFDNAIEGIFQTTPTGRYMDANSSLARIYGYDSPAELMEALTDISTQLYVDSNRRADFVTEMEQNGAVSSFEAQIYQRNGEIIWISENARAVRDSEGEVLFYEGTVEDISKRKVAEEQLLHDALHDKLTGLSNRALFMDRLAQSFGRLRRHPGVLFAALFLDFDRFKNVNDSLGHFAGDQMLIQIARRLEQCLRPGDTVARFGGDEFAILLEDIRDVDDATTIAERIQHEMKTPFMLKGQQVFTSASIGIALAHSNYEKPEDLLRDADMAMYRAKGMGRARHEVFDAGMHTRAVALLQLETDLRFAIERSEFRLFYQPIIALKSSQVVGYEALLRWQHPERGLVMPNEFVTVAEETGWIVPIGLWVLEESCRQIARWRSEFPAHDALYVSVNLSSKQFTQTDLLSQIERILEETALAPAALKLEITETSLMDGTPAITERLMRLQGMGVRLSLDDFGTGYSSLSYLHRYPLQTLKIDRSFISQMGDAGENLEIVRTITTLGQNLGLTIVAEGIETLEQLAQLRALHCQNGQGYLFARPLPPEKAAALLAEDKRW